MRAWRCRARPTQGDSDWRYPGRALSRTMFYFVQCSQRRLTPLVFLRKRGSHRQNLGSNTLTMRGCRI